MFVTREYLHVVQGFRGEFHGGKFGHRTRCVDHRIFEIFIVRDHHTVRDRSGDGMPLNADRVVRQRQRRGWESEQIHGAGVVAFGVLLESLVPIAELIGAFT